LVEKSRLIYWSQWWNHRRLRVKKCLIRHTGWQNKSKWSARFHPHQKHRTMKKFLTTQFLSKVILHLQSKIKMLHQMRMNNLKMN
jgi:hypothetical protein